MNIEQNILTEIEDIYILNNMTTYELRENFKLLKILILEYETKLKKLLILSKPMELIDFFSDTEKKLLLFNNIFKQVKDTKIRDKINFYIEQIKSVNNEKTTLFLNKTSYY
jgi:hypothetical protein